jgi:hypothetical protein
LILALSTILEYNKKSFSGGVELGKFYNNEVDSSIKNPI